VKLGGNDGGGEDSLPLSKGELQIICSGMLASRFMEELSDHLFWDVKRESVDAERHARFLIGRIMDRGTREDVRAAWSYYGPERIKASLLEAPALDRKTVVFFANQFRLPREDFRAWRKERLNWEP